MAKTVARKAPDTVKHIFRQDSKEFKFLLKLFKTGKIGDLQPAAVRAMFPDQFGKFTSNQFRPQFNKAKALCGQSVAPAPAEDNDNDEFNSLVENVMPPACHVSPVPSSNVANVASFSGSNDNDSALEDSPQFDHTVWVFKKLVKQWENEHGIRMATIIFWLSIGTTPKDVETAINTSGQKLSIREKWYCDLLDVAEFYELYQQYTQEPIGDTNVRSHAMKQH
ncbi:hypothetical protein (Partial), partial [Seminavis robusta]|eukprot:Sro3923_g351900.1 n/a (222) ;mRNA; r:118-883